MKGSPFIGPFETEIKEWENKLVGVKIVFIVVVE